ncbi:MAG: hypothetical protein KAI89_02185 [Emcibacter sp.]|nr:hypothetical protein [Emcibacter sp.]
MAVPKEIYLIAALPLTAVGKTFNPLLKQDTMKRAFQDAFADFNMTLKISVEPDKTYGTVTTIEVDSDPSEEIMGDVRQALNQYAFHIIIKNKNEGF